MKARDKPKNCTECGKCHTCTDAMYGSINCKPEPAVNPKRYVKHVTGICREYGGDARKDKE